MNAGYHRDGNGRNLKLTLLTTTLKDEQRKEHSTTNNWMYNFVQPKALIINPVQIRLRLLTPCEFGIVERIIKLC